MPRNFILGWFALICALSLTACGGGDTSACSDENFRPPVSFYVNENNEITSYGPAYNRAASIALLQGVWVNAYWGVMTISADGSFSIDPSIELAGITRSIGYLVHYEGTIALVDPDQNIYAVKRRLIKEPRPGSGLPSFSGDNVAHVFFYLSDSACGETNDLLFYAGTEPPTGVTAYAASDAFRRVVQ
jgi:hypothetical protein